MYSFLIIRYINENIVRVKDVSCNSTINTVQIIDVKNPKDES